MKLHLYITIVFCSILLMSCGEEASKNKEASAEHTSIKMPADEKGNAGTDVEATDNKTVASNDIEPNNTESRPTEIKGSQNFDPNKDNSYYDENTAKGGKPVKKNDTDTKINPRKGGVPQMIFQEETYNFGTVEAGENVKVAFELTNTGTGDLLISNAKGSCGCTEPSFSFLPIEPKQKSTIDVTFKTAGREGMQRKSITITSNAYPRIRKLYLEGRVVKKGETQEVKEPKTETEEIKEDQ